MSDLSGVMAGLGVVTDDTQRDTYHDTKRNTRKVKNTVKLGDDTQHATRYDTQRDTKKVSFLATTKPTKRKNLHLDLDTCAMLDELTSCFNAQQNDVVKTAVTELHKRYIKK